MSEITRRTLVRASTFTAAAAQGTAAPADEPRSGQGIRRFVPGSVHPGVPRIHHVVVHGGIVYVAGITVIQALSATELSALLPSAGSSGYGDVADQTRRICGRIDVADQTRRICGRIDELLAIAGTSKAKLLTAQVWLTDMKDFTTHNDAWNEWVDLDNAPVRACVQSPQLILPGLLVEIMVTAAL